MRLKGSRLTSLLLVLALLTAVLPGAALAAEALTVTHTPSGDSQTLGIEGLDGKTDVYAVQLELTVDGEFPDAKFRAADSKAYQPELKPEVKNGSTHLTIYVVNGDKPLNSGNRLTLGTLTMGSERGGKAFAMPDTVKLSMLNEALRPLSVADGASVQTAQRQPSAGGGGTVAPMPTPVPTNTDLPFTDVQPQHWFYSAVQYVYEHQMMSGMTATTFAPDLTVTRGMIVTILYRMEGSPAAGKANFTDVPADRYYAKAIAWATSHGIVSGYPNKTFAPESNITREQLAFILYRYAAYKEYDTAGRSGLTKFTDVSDVTYAKEALEWAVSENLITGVTNTTLVPKGSATRAQAASILMRFCESVAE